MRLITIDPENREDVGRLVALYWSARQGFDEAAWVPPREIDAMQEAAREYAEQKGAQS